MVETQSKAQQASARKSAGAPETWQARAERAGVSVEMVHVITGMCDALDELNVEHVTLAWLTEWLTGTGTWRDFWTTQLYGDRLKEHLDLGARRGFNAPRHINAQRRARSTFLAELQRGARDGVDPLNEQLGMMHVLRWSGVLPGGLPSLDAAYHETRAHREKRERVEHVASILLSSRWGSGWEARS